MASDTKVDYTPGPWKVIVDSYGGFNRIWSPEGDDVATCMGDGAIPKEERHANERLIAAAPELAEALKELTLVYTSIYPVDKLPPSIVKAESALLKAGIR